MYTVYMYVTTKSIVGMHSLEECYNTCEDVMANQCIHVHAIQHVGLFKKKKQAEYPSARPAENSVRQSCF